MPPSAMIGTSCGAAARAQSAIAVIIGTPMPATTRVVQIDPAPMPTLTASTPRSISASRRLGGGDVAGDEVDVGKRAPHAACTMSSTPCECPCAVSMTSTSTCAATSASARSIVSVPTPIAAPTRSRPRPSLHAFGYLTSLLDVLDRDEALQPEVARRRPGASRPCAGGGSRAPRRASCRPAR